MSRINKVTKLKRKTVKRTSSKRTLSRELGNYITDEDSTLKKIEEESKYKFGLFINLPKKEEAKPEIKPEIKSVESENLTDEGRIHIITGYGKYKTSAAFGTALRALNVGWKVLSIQFMKGQVSGELELLNKTFKNFVGYNFGNDKIVLPQNKHLDDEEKCRAAWLFMKEQVACTDYKMLILDEILNAVEMKMIYKSELFNFLDNKPKDLEVICTGRLNNKAFYQQLVLKSSLFSDIHCVKHYFERQCPDCKRSYPYHTNFCPQDGTELIESRAAKKGIEF